MIFDLTGKVVAWREIDDGRFVINVLQAAHDEYSSPNTFAVMADRKFAEVGELVDIVVTLRAWIKKNRYVDKQGVEQEIYNQNMACDFVSKAKAK